MVTDARGRDLVSVVAELESEVAALRSLVSEMQALAKGDPGRDGKDGRDGRDGKSVNAERLLAMIRGVVQRPAQAIHVEAAPAQVVVQASDVILEASIVAAPAPNVENHVHVEGMSDLTLATEELRKTLAKPVRPIFEKGKLVGVRRDDGDDQHDAR